MKLKIYNSDKSQNFDLMQEGYSCSGFQGLGQQYSNTLVYNKVRYYNQYREYKYPDFVIQISSGLGRYIASTLYNNLLNFLNSDELFSIYFESNSDNYYIDVVLSQVTQSDIQFNSYVEKFTFNRLGPKYDWVDKTTFNSIIYPLAVYNNTEHPVRPLIIEAMKLENDNPPYKTQINATPKNLAIVKDWMTTRILYNGNGISAYYDKLTNELVINGYGTTAVEFNLKFETLPVGNAILSIIPNQDIESKINVWGMSDKTGPSLQNIAGTTYFYSYQLPFNLLHFQTGSGIYYNNYRLKFQIEQRLLTDNLLYTPVNLTTKVGYQVDIGVPPTYSINENLFSAGTMTISAIDGISYGTGDYNLLVNCDLNEKITIAFSSNSGTQNSSFHIVDENTSKTVYIVTSTNGTMNVNYTFTTVSTKYRIIFRCYYQATTTFSVTSFAMNYGNLTGWRNTDYMVSGNSNEYRLFIDFNTQTWEFRFNGKFSRNDLYIYPLKFNPIFENASLIYEYISGNFNSTGNGEMRLWVFTGGKYTEDTSLNIFKTSNNYQNNSLDNYYFTSKSVNNLRFQILDSTGVSTYDNLIFKASLFNKNITNIKNYIGDKFIQGLSTATPYSSPYVQEQTIKFLNNSLWLIYVNDTLIVDSENKKVIYNGNNNYNNVDKSGNSFLNITDDVVVKVGDAQFLNVKYKKWRKD